MRRPNQNLTKHEAAIKRQVAARHGYTIPRGVLKGQGSAFQLDLAIITGDLATVLLPDEQRDWLIGWLQQQAQQFAEYSIEREALQSLAEQLLNAAQREYGAGDATP